MWLGVDPGKQGGAVLLSDTGDVLGVWALTWLGKTKFRLEAEREYGNHHVEEMRGILRHARGLSSADPGQRLPCYLEAVTGFRGMPAPLNAVLTLGRGLWWGVLVAERWNVHHIQPQEWQPKFLDETDLPKGMRLKNYERKRRFKAAAETLWPDQKWTLKTADAALIAEHGRRVSLSDS